MMKTIFISKAILIIVLSFNTMARAQNFMEIFNGQDFYGWKIIGADAKVSIEDHAIKLNQKANTAEHTFVVSKKKYKDFILELDAKREPGFHYGILFRAQKAPDTAHVRLYGYQIKVDHDKKRNWTGGIFDDFGNTWNWIYTLENDQRAQNALKPEGQWDHYRIEVKDNNIKVWVNNIPTSNITNSKYKKGFIALKIHFLGNKPENEKPSAWIKNIKIATKSLEKYFQEIDIPSVITE